MSHPETLERPVKGAHLAVAVAALTLLLAYTDRLLPNLFIEPIKKSFGVSDTQVALLTGFSFFAAMAVFTVPLSWIADRFDRVRLIAFSTLLWCALTIGFGLAQDFWTLFFMRMGVGIGEGVLVPTLYSLLADLFPPKQMARPITLLSLATLMGNVMAYNGGGALYEVFSAWARSGHAPFATVDAWRAVTVSFGALGLILAVLAALLIPEPRRTRPRNPDAHAAKPTPLAPFLLKGAFFFVPLIGSMCAFTLYNAGFSGWTAPLLGRQYGWSIGQIGQVVGTIALVSGLLGAPLGLALNEWFLKRLGRNPPVAVVFWTVAFTIPITLVVPFAPGGWWAAAGLFLINLSLSAATVVTPPIFMNASPSHLRARIYAFSTLCFSLLGTSLGQLTYALVTDKVLGGPQMLPWSMSVVSAVLLTLCVLGLGLSDRRFERATQMARDHSL